ncbi:MAG: hypothetical protein WBK67_00100 [Minisyncoccales bacterium]
MSKEASDMYKKFLSESGENKNVSIYAYIDWLVDSINKKQEALENIHNLGLNVMTSDQRWGCAFSYAREVLK